MIEFTAGLLIVLLTLAIGARYGSLALGAISGIGLSVLVFGFGLKPGTPPTDVIYIIIAAVTCASVLQSAGGMTWMLQIAEKIIRNNPAKITYIAPLCTFFLTVLVGTGHVVYTLMPVIADVALKNNIRPERPCAVASIASQVGIIGSPISAAVTAFVAISAEYGFETSNVAVVCLTIPASIIGLLCASACYYRWGKELDKDPDFQAKMSDSETRSYILGNNATTLNQTISSAAKLSVYIFLGAISIIVFFSLMQILGHDIRPEYISGTNADGVPVMKRLGMNIIIQMVMISAAALMILICKADLKRAVSDTVFRSGMVAVVAIYGIAWMSDTLFSNSTELIKSSLGTIVDLYPWSIAFIFFTVSVLINSQGAVVVAMLPLAYAMDIPGAILLGLLPSVYGYFFIPNYPSDIATVNFDRSGTTRIGKYLLNHSFMVPGLVSVAVSTTIGYLAARFFLL